MKPGQGKLHHSRASRLTHGRSTVATSMQPHGDGYVSDRYVSTIASPAHGKSLGWPAGVGALN